MLDGDRLRRIAKMLSFVKNDVQRARYVRHYVYFYDRSDSTYVERVLHDRRDETLHIF